MKNAQRPWGRGIPEEIVEYQKIFGAWAVRCIKIMNPRG